MKRSCLSACRSRTCWLDALDQLRRQAAARRAICCCSARRPASPAGRCAAVSPPLGCRDAARWRRPRALQLGNHLLDRTAGRRLDDEEVDHHDAEQGRHHEQQAAQDVGAHRSGCRVCQSLAAVRSIACRRSGCAAPSPSRRRSTRCRRPTRLVFGELLGTAEACSSRRSQNSVLICQLRNDELVPRQHAVQGSACARPGCRGRARRRSPARSARRSPGLLMPIVFCGLPARDVGRPWSPKYSRCSLPGDSDWPHRSMDHVEVVAVGGAGWGTA